MNRRTVRAAALLVLVSLAVGLIVGVLWAVIAPRPELVASSGRLVDAVAYPQAYVAADAWLGLLCAGAGLVLAVLGFARWYPGNPDDALVGLGLGGIIGSIVAWRVGSGIGGGPVPLPTDGATIAGPLELRSYGVLLFWPTWVAIVGLAVGASRRGRRRRRETALNAGAMTVEPAEQS